MPFSSRKILCFCLALGAALPALAHAQTNLELWHSLTGLRRDALERMVGSFNASQPNYRVQPVFKAVDADLSLQLVAMHRNGKAPHMAHLDQAAGYALSAHRNVYRPAQLVMQEAGQTLKSNAYLSGILDASIDTLGRVASMPLGAATVAFYFNRDILARAGIDPDAKLQTWRDVQIAALKIVDTDTSACAYSSDRQTWVLIENTLALHDQSLTDHSGPFSHVSGLNFSNRLLMRHIGMLSSWAKSGIFSYFGPHGEAGERFGAGECAMLTASSSLYPQLSKSLGQSLVMTALPVHDDLPTPNGRTLSNGSGLWILSGRERKDYRGVGLFLAYLSRPEMQAQWHQATGDLPLTHQAHELSRKAGFYAKNPWAEIAIHSTRSEGQARNLPVRKFIPQIPQWGKIREILDGELESVWAQHKTPKEALDDASERSNKLLRLK